MFFRIVLKAFKQKRKSLLTGNSKSLEAEQLLKYFKNMILLDRQTLRTFNNKTILEENSDELHFFSINKL